MIKKTSRNTQYSQYASSKTSHSERALKRDYLIQGKLNNESSQLTLNTKSFRHSS